MVVVRHGCALCGDGGSRVYVSVRAMDRQGGMREKPPKLCLKLTILEDEEDSRERERRVEEGK